MKDMEASSRLTNAASSRTMRCSSSWVGSGPTQTGPLQHHRKCMVRSVKQRSVSTARGASCSGSEYQAQRVPFHSSRSGRSSS